MNFVLDESTVADLIGPGTSPELRATFREAQLQKRLIQLALIRKAVLRHAPTLLEASGFDKAWDILRSVPRPALLAVAWSPTFGRWAAVGRGFIERDSYRLLPDGQVTSHLADLAWFALAAAVRAESTCALDVRADHRGVICLPSTLTHLAGGEAAAGRTVRVEVVGGVLQPPEGWVLVSDTALAANIQLAWRDSYLAYESDDQTFEEVDAGKATRWKHTVADAFDIMRRTTPEYAAEVEAELQALVPLDCPSEKLNVSSSSADGYGMLQVSWHARPVVIAETLVHEYHHTKLNAVLDLVRLVDDPLGTSDLYSPWRDDARPAVGMLHGIWAFHSVVCFWNALARNGSGAAEAPFEYLRRHSQVEIAMDVLRRSGRLSPEGGSLVDAVEGRLRALPPVPDGDRYRRRVADELAAHRLRWQLRHEPPVSPLLEELLAEWNDRGGRLRAHQTMTLRFAPDGIDEAGLAAELGVPEGVLANRPQAGVPIIDPTLNVLSQMSVREPEHFTEIRLRIKAAARGPLGALLAAHAAYVAGEFALAREGYAQALTHCPGNFDVWRAFAFTCRQLGDTEISEAFLFHPLTVVRLAEALCLDGELLPALAPAASYYDLGPRPWIGLLAWVRARAARG